MGAPGPGLGLVACRCVCCVCVCVVCVCGVCVCVVVLGGCRTFFAGLVDCVCVGGDISDVVMVEIDFGDGNVVGDRC